MDEAKSFSMQSSLIPFFSNDNESYQCLLEQIANAKIVLLGEATHGTYEFYFIRQKITQHLIQEKGFNAVLIEGDWPSCYTVNLYIQGKSNLDMPNAALRNFKHFPTWMWRNEVVAEFIQWLKKYNEENFPPVGFYGLDLYSLHASIKEVIRYLADRDPLAAQEAVQRYSCFDHLAIDPQEYSVLVRYAKKSPCIKEVTEQLLAMQEKNVGKLQGDKDEIDQLFYATQNANLVKNAESYYRALLDPYADTWNIRDRHMFETLQNTIAHLDKKLGNTAKVVVWAHNSHVGNAKATEMAKRGELNIGQLVKDNYPKDSFSLGFSTYAGTVLAASEWGGIPQYKAINPAIQDSYEDMFHNFPYKDFLLCLNKNLEVQKIFATPKLQRAIGVIYRPDTELISHYYQAKLAFQFDALIHIDITKPIMPLD